MQGYLEKAWLYDILGNIMLSSDILEQQFGPTEIVVIFQGQKYRIIETIAQRNKTVLELSLVTFDESNVNVFSYIHNKVLGGLSMGKAFREAGIAFIRDVHFVNHQTVPSDIQTKFNSAGQATIVDIDILVGPDKIHYCHITEIYSPILSWPDRDARESPNINKRLREFSQLLSTVL